MEKNQILKLFIFFLTVFLLISCEPVAETDNAESSNNTNISSPSTDKDGYSYKTVTIGTQVWFAENLKTTKYNDGTAIPLVTGNSAWSSLYSPGYCWYNNDATTNKSAYGALYNWYTINTGKLCPTGWHVPSYDEWLKLTTYLEGEDIAGGKLKETGTSHWLSPNTGATNSTGFTAIPGGNRHSDGTFNNIGINGIWWSSFEVSSAPSGNAWYWVTTNNLNKIVKSSTSRQYGFSVRCLKD